MNDIALEIARLRRAAGLTQLELAQRLKTQQSAIARLEKPGYTGHNLRTLHEIAQALGCQLQIRLVDIMMEM